AMTIYEGRRTIDGLVVTVDGKRLDEHYEIKRFTRFGFEWTYEGDSPQQLALAILFDRLGNKERAIQLSEPFMKTVIANLDNDWKLTSEEIDAFVRGNPQTELVNHPGRNSMSLSRRSLLKSAAAAGALAASGEMGAPAIAQNRPVRIGILAPRSGIAAAPGE